MSEIKVVLTPGRVLSISFEGRQGEISLAYPIDEDPEVRIRTRDDGDVELYAFIVEKVVNHDDEDS